jgi:hypothetical protein
MITKSETLNPPTIPPSVRGGTIVYWTTTGLIGSIMLWSAYHFGFDPEMKGAFVHLGFPDYFRLELTVAKALGAMALLIPAVPQRVKEFTYHGFAIVIASAIVAHASSGDGIFHVIDPLVILTILVVSYVYNQKRAAGLDKGTNS